MNEVINQINEAAEKSDRWLFIACLVVLGLVGIFIWRWIVSDREKLSKRLTEMTDRHIATTEKVIEVVANNTAVLNRVEKKL